MGLVDYILRIYSGGDSPLLILMTTENIIDTIWLLSKDLKKYYFSVNTKTNYCIVRVYSIF
jgi:hypothetical protein